METDDATPTEDRNSETSAIEPPRCPVCGGKLAQMRGMDRCTRCYFCVCVACEGALR
jgi:hypothetical protein